MTATAPNIPLPYFPFVSIVIPVYNGRKTIQTCLEAILQQEYPREQYEVIVVDNNSSDGTPDLVQKYPVKLVYEKEIQGPHAATNTGVKEAKGEILVFTDSDCVPEPDWLRKLIAPLADSSVVGTGGRIEAYRPSTPVERFLDQMKPFKNAYQASPNFPAALITGNCAIRREDFMAAGMFNPNMYTGAEVDLSYRVQLQTGKRVVYVPEAVVYHIFSPTVKRLGRHFYIYGYSEILLGTIYKNVPGYPWTPTEQFKIMLRQVKALFTYLASFSFRVISYPFRRKVDQDYFLTPLFWFWVELNNLRGKIEGLWVTRFYRRKFWEKGVRVI
ncbi:glycosyltransferase [Anaerolinea sp.]|uniref:glycosyltransferase n=1 Tax=Anaerolinea sp. TaxID=1872519 RepID=UPI002ACE5C2F|nr:glycosyltransferase [Anaerolinea sp.]